MPRFRKLTLLGATIIATACGAQSLPAADAGATQRTTALSAELRNALAFGEVRNLDEVSPDIDKSLYLRLLNAPDPDRADCFVETHGTCAYRYFVTVATYDTYPETAVHALPISGEITDIAWEPVEAVDTARLRLSYTAFTAAALANNPALEADRKTVTVQVSPETLDVD